MFLSALPTLFRGADRQGASKVAMRRQALLQQQHSQQPGSIQTHKTVDTHHQPPGIDNKQVPEPPSLYRPSSFMQTCHADLGHLLSSYELLLAQGNMSPREVMAVTKAAAWLDLPIEAGFGRAIRSAADVPSVTLFSQGGSM